MTSRTIEASIDLSVPVRTAYDQWTQFEKFPEIMKNVEQVEQIDEKTLRWKTKVGIKKAEWTAEITEQIPDKRIAWKSLSGSRNAGVVTFHRLDDQHSRVMLQMAVDPEGGLEKAGASLGVLDGAIRGELERFRDFIERKGTATGAWRDSIPNKDEH